MKIARVSSKIMHSPNDTLVNNKITDIYKKKRCDVIKSDMIKLT